MGGRKRTLFDELIEGLDALAAQRAGRRALRTLHATRDAMPAIPPPPHRGGCLCGAVRYRYDAPPLATVACHCRDCQKFTGATNLLTIYADRAAFRHEQGELARYRKRADSGREADYVRCANCGTRLWHEPLAAPQWVFIAAGTLDDPSWVVPAAHIWVSRAAPSARIPRGVATWKEGPKDRTEIIAAFRAAHGGTRPGND